MNMRGNIPRRVPKYTPQQIQKMRDERRASIERRKQVEADRNRIETQVEVLDVTAEEVEPE